ncbi:MAG TPA: hypothetical protein VGF55_13075 [Gemmataceae bacterium]|jgi:hypothetical protein
MPVADDRPGRPTAAFLLVAAQLTLALVVVHQFELARKNHLFPILCVAAGGFLVHLCLPPRARLPFFVLLSLGGILFYLGWPNGAWLIGLGGALVAVARLPVPLALRAALAALAAVALTVARAGSEAPFWPVLGSMFMFRLVIYLFDQRRAAGRPPLALTLAYFFPLPNVGFPFFPILDFQTFRDTYRPAAALDTAATGVGWIARGLVHLLLYRVVRYYLLPAPYELADLPHVALFLAANYALYLHVSGTFHVITGVLHLFGFDLPRTHLNYFLASSFTDIWRRINIYWKDFMSKVVFFPAFFALRGVGTRAALAAAAVAVFLATWVLHAYQVFWISGGFPLTPSDAGLWLIAGGLVAANLQLDLVRSQRQAGRTVDRGRRTEGTVFGSLWLSVRVVGMFALVSVFWACWNTPLVVRYVAAADRRGGGVVAAILLAAVVVGTVGQLAWERLRRLDLLPARPPAAVAAVPTAVLAALAVLGIPAVTGALGAYPAAVIASLRRESATPAEAALAVQGYYEEITAVPVPTGPLLAALEGRPPPGSRTHYPEMTRPADAWLVRELIPGWTGEIAGGRITVNRFGMRDRDRTREKPPGTCRLAVVGSSVVMGYGVDDDQVFTRLLEDRLNAGRAVGRCEVLNFGEGLSDALHRRVVVDRQAWAFDPDAVYYVAHQDELSAPVRQLAGLVVRGEPLLYGLGDVVRGAGITPDMDRLAVEARLLPLGRQIILAVYRDLAADCRRRGVPLVWVYLPMPGVTSTPVQAAAFVDLAAGAGLTTADLSAWWDGYEPAAVTVGGTDYHANALGHRLIAGRFEALLRQRPELAPACARGRE